MASRHFPRANFTDTDSLEDSEQHHFEDGSGAGFTGRIVNLHGNEQGYLRQNQNGSDVPGSGIGESGFAHPAWQRYFFLAPNVRFTRTPDREIRKVDAEEDKPAQGDAGKSPVQAPDPAVSGTSMPSSVARQVAPGVRAAAVSRPASAAASTATAAPAPARQTTGEAGAVRPIAASNPKWSHLSDHAFFEFIPYAVEFARLRRQTEAASVPAVPKIAAVAPAPVAVAPTVARNAGPRPLPGPEITALYRVIEWPATAKAADAADVAAPAWKEPVDETPGSISAAPASAPIESHAPVDQPAAETNAAPAPSARSVAITMPVPRQPSLPVTGKVAQPGSDEDYEFPSEELLQQPPEGQGFYMSQERLEQNADLLESVLEDFGVKGEIIHVRPGPVVTLYEFEPAPGVKSSRVIGLADDIARSMSAISARVAVVPGRNVIGIELPNETRETVYFRELIESDGFRNTSCKLALCLGKTIGGEPVIAELAKMPHLLVAGTTGSGKSVAINTMILSLLYRLKPDECRLIMVDPKMLELSIYDGIPHLLTPVVTDPKKAVTALKWAVREMEDRYRKMARLGVRNIDGYNQRAALARDKGETVVMQVQTGFEKGTGAPLFEEQEIDLAPMPYIVVIVDEMADLMMVAGKEIEGAIQRLAQMARAAGIHLIMATQRPSVDVITGTIKANFPTRISFQVTSKIDSRTILGEQGAEQLLGQGDMLHMAGGGRIARVHGPFVSDAEVEHVVAHLKSQGRPEYLETVTADEEDEEAEADQGPVFDRSAIAAEDGDNVYDDAVKVVLRDKKCSTSYIQRRLGVGYNRAASLVERMEKEGIVGAPNHVGKREILLGKRDHSSERGDIG
jgi:S-DNA-T family DNA segregation ATPase FtsK/SpoIIIE